MIIRMPSPGFFHGITTLGCWTSQEVTVSSWFTKQYPYGISPLYPLGMPPSNTADFQAVGFRWLTVTWAMGRSTSLMPPGCDTDGTSGGRGSVDFCKSKSHLWISRNSWNWSVLYILYGQTPAVLFSCTGNNVAPEACEIQVYRLRSVVFWMCRWQTLHNGVSLYLPLLMDSLRSAKSSRFVPRFAFGGQQPVQRWLLKAMPDLGHGLLK